MKDIIVVALLVLAPIAVICSLIQRRLRWKVGIVRVPSPGSWTAARGTVLLRKELLVAGTAPEPRIAELADEVRSGRFDPSTGPVA